MIESQNCFTEEYVAQVIHDLKTPVLSIGGYAKRLFEEKLGPLNHDQKATLQTILQTAERLEHDLAWIVEHATAGQLVWEQAYPQRFDLIEHVTRVTDTVKALAQRNKQSLQLDVQEGQLEIYADPRMIDRAVSELIHNALKHSGEGDVVTISLNEKDGNVELAVSDQGEGFDPEKLEQIFQPWEQVVQIEDRNIRGVGIGLANVRRYAEAHNGKVLADTTLGKGSTFRLILPLPSAPESLPEGGESTG
ncbi:MAG: HAMP domain-containing histidine kinase [Deltaproteobacteria bacterium]|nr:HAMP domain-containing histidine kinase [Deltaproteobacteria bacterium]